MSDFNWRIFPLDIFLRREHNVDNLNDLIASYLKEHNININEKFEGYTCLHYSCVTRRRDLLFCIINNYSKIIDIDARTPSGETALHLAIKQDDKYMVDILLNSGADPNVPRNDDGRTALHLSIFNESSDILLSLLKIPTINVNSENNKTFTALHEAVRREQWFKVELLLYAGADPNPKRSLTSPLHLVVGHTYDIITNCLVRKKARLDAVDFHKYTPLHSAVVAQNETIVKALLDNNANANFETSPPRKSIIHLAVERNNLRIFSMILEKTNLIDEADFDGLTPLQKAVLAKDESKVRLLLERKANPVVQYKNKMLLLHAVEGGNFSIIKMLLQNMPAPAINLLSEEGVTPLEAAIKSKRLDIVDILLTHGADVNIQNEDGNCPLHIVCQKDSLEMGIRLLTTPGLDIDARNKAGLTPLILAYELNNQMMVDHLILSGADPNIPDPRTGQTPLHEAVGKSTSDTLYLLLQKEIINLDAKNSFEETPLKLAVDLGKLHAVEMLVDRGADVNITYYLRKTLFHMVSAEGNIAMLKILLKAQNITMLDSRDDCGNTPLGLAVKSGDESLAKLLISNGADPNHISNHSKPINVAVANQHESMVRLLLTTGELEVDKSAILIATEKNKSVILDLLLEKNQALPKKNRIAINSLIKEHKQTLLHVAVQLQHTECVKVLLKYKADPNKTDKKSRTPLHLAPDATITKLLIDSGATVNALDEQMWSPLHYAVKRRDVNSVILLLEHGANVSYANSDYGQTPLFLTVTVDENITKEDKKKMLAILVVLLEVEGIIVDLKDHKGATPLYYAVNGDFPEAVKALLANKPESEMIFGNESLLHTAAENRYSDVLKELLKYNALQHINSFDRSDRTPLMISVEKQDFESVKELLQYAPDVNLRGFSDTALTIALKHKSREIIDLLLNVPTINVNISEAEKKYPLHLAVMRNCTDLVKRLIELGADPNAEELEFGRTPLHTAVEKQLIKLVEYLVNLENIYLDVPDNHGLTPLHMACKINVLGLDENIIDILIQKGADLDLPNEEGDTAVHYIAANRVLSKQLEVIIKKDTRRLDIQNNSGNTPLHLVCRNLDSVNIKILLREGASLEITNGYGKTPPDLYIQSLYQFIGQLSRRMVPPTMKKAAISAMEILIDTQQTDAFEILIELSKKMQWFDEEYLSCLLYYSIRNHQCSSNISQTLLECGADMNFKMTFSQDGRPDTTLAIAVERPPILELLLADPTCEVNFLDDYSRTALHYAVQRNYPHQTLLLLERGANPNAFDSSYNTPLCYAGHRDVIILLLRFGANPFIRESVLGMCLSICPNHLISRAVVKNFLSNDDADLNKLNHYFSGNVIIQQIINVCVENIADCVTSIDSLIDDKLPEEVTYGDILLQCYPEINEGNIKRIKEIIQMDYHRQVIPWCLDFLKTQLTLIELALPIVKPIGKSSITLKSIMGADRDQVARYLQSREVVKFLNSTNLTVYTPRYSQQLSQRIQLGNEVITVRNLICNSIPHPDIRENFSFGKLPIECMEFILKMLKWDDLLNLAEALSLNIDFEDRLKFSPYIQDEE